ncbi:MAG: hypothetical protein JNJ88_06430 [Planctomycetes bacterium]|nr:hypothetical protein [Planctomycetota bacterium]
MTPMIRVHVTLQESIANDPDQRQRARQLIVELHGMQNANLKRLERFGILSGDVEPSAVQKIRTLKEVAAVEIDGQKQDIHERESGFIRRRMRNIVTQLGALCRRGTEREGLAYLVD